MIEKIVGAALSILITKARDKAADSLKDGDITSERFREIIVRELKDIKHKLDALCKKDLNASVDFYETGVHLLCDYFSKQHQQIHVDGRDKNSNDQQSEEGLSSHDQQLGNQLALEGGSDVSSNDDVSEQPSKSAFVNYFQKTFSLVAGYFTESKDANTPQTETSVQAAEKGQELFGDDISPSEKQHQIQNTECLHEAKKKFELAEEYATLAFNNEALKGFDRITAQKLRITATILMHVDSPNAAVACCKRYLEQLNSLRFVSEAFEVQGGEGFKDATRRLFNEDERKEVIETVKNINEVAFSFGRIAFPEGTELLRDWPNVVKTRKRAFPIPVQLKVLDREMWLVDVAVNDQGTVACLSKGSVTLFSSEGRFISEFGYYSGSSIPKAVCMDNEQNIYISEFLAYSIRIDEDSREDSGLNVYTKNGKKNYAKNFSGKVNSILLDSKNEVFALNTNEEDQRKSIIKGRDKQYEVTLAALKEALTNKNSTTRQFLEERRLILDVARKEDHEFIILGPQRRGLSVYQTFYGEALVERITWNPKNGDVIHRGDHCLEIYTNERKSPFQFHVPRGGIAVVSPAGQVVLGREKLYFF